MWDADENSTEHVHQARAARSRPTESKKSAVKLRTKLAALTEQSDDLVKQNEKLQKKLDRANERKAELYNENKVLNRQVSFCYKYFVHVNDAISRIKSRKLKSQILPFLSSKFDLIRRAPTAKLSLQVGRRIDRKLKRVRNERDEETESFRKKLRDTVVFFFEKDENSAPAPSAREFITRKMVRKRKRYLTATVDNLYSKFCTSHPTLKVSRTVFYSLRPFWVTKRKITARDTCLCKEHANFSLIFFRLRCLKILQARDVHDFVKSLCCDNHNKNCMFRECKTCANRQVQLTEPNRSTWYHSWVSEKIRRLGAKGLMYDVKITSKQMIHCTLSQLVLKFNQMIPKFLVHEFRVHHQLSAMETIQNNMGDNDAYVLIDFSQNWICKYAEEIQSVHFGASQRQISLQTGGFYIRDDSGKLVFESFASISDCVRHDAAAVWALLKPVIAKILELKPGLRTIHFQSDGPTTQYKNKTNFFLLNLFCKKLKLYSASWNFSPAGHGKSAADGIGGTVKSMCDTAVSNGRDIICAEDMIRVVTDQHSVISPFLVTEQDINSIDELIPTKLKTIPKTMLTHQISWVSETPNNLSLRYLSCSDCVSRNYCSHYELEKTLVNYEIYENDSSELIEPNAPFSVSENDWIVIISGKTWYPGLVENVSGNSITASFLVRRIKLFTWPKTPDTRTVLVSQILCKIKAPSEVTTKSSEKIYYRLTEEEISHVNTAAAKSNIRK